MHIMGLNIPILDFDAWHGLVETPGTQGAWILYAHDKCPIMNQHHDRARVLGVWIRPGSSASVPFKPLLSFIMIGH